MLYRTFSSVCLVFWALAMFRTVSKKSLAHKCINDTSTASPMHTWQNEYNRQCSGNVHRLTRSILQIMAKKLARISQMHYEHAQSCYVCSNHQWRRKGWSDKRKRLLIMSTTFSNRFWTKWTDRTAFLVKAIGASQYCSKCHAPWWAWFHASTTEP